jgi:hypothetical protein
MKYSLIRSSWRKEESRPAAVSAAGSGGRITARA